MASVQMFYYYTSTAGANVIRNDKVLRSQNGLKLSTLKPEHHSRDDILRNIYGNTIPPEFKNRADNVVFISGSILDASKLFQISPNLYKYTGDINVSAADVKDKPGCVNRGSSWGSSTQGSCSQGSSSLGSSSQSSSNSSGSGSSGSGSSGLQNCPQTLYYYTNQSTANLILSTQSIPFNHYVFLTTMKPEDYFRAEILKIIYGTDYDRKQYASFADWCVKVDVTKLSVNKLKQNHSKVFEYAGSIQVDPSQVMDKPKCNKGGQNQRSATQEYLYHYTNSKGAVAIKACGYIKKSGASGPFGDGVYMTMLQPTDFFRDEILRNNYGGINSAFKGRADWVVRIKKSDLEDKKLKTVDSSVTKDESRKIFCYEDVVHVNSSDVFDKPKCYRAK